MEQGFEDDSQEVFRLCYSGLLKIDFFHNNWGKTIGEESYFGPMAIYNKHVFRGFQKCVILRIHIIIYFPVLSVLFVYLFVFGVRVTSSYTGCNHSFHCDVVLMN